MTTESSYMTRSLLYLQLLQRLLYWFMLRFIWGSQLFHCMLRSSLQKT